MTKKSIFKVGIILSVVSMGVLAFFSCNNNNTKENSQSGSVETSVNELVSDYVKDEKDANAKYLNKILILTGEIMQVELNMDYKTVLTFKTGDPLSAVTCTMKNASDLKIGDNVKIKGLCTGFVGDVRLIDGEIIN